MTDVSTYQFSNDEGKYNLSRDELLEYLKTARSIETSLIEVERIERHQVGQINEIASRGYPDFAPPHKDLGSERRRTFNEFKTAGNSIGAIGGLVFGIATGLSATQWSDNPFSLIGDLVVFGVCVLIFSGIGALIGAGAASAFGWTKGQESFTEKERQNSAARKKWEREVREQREKDEKAVEDFLQSLRLIGELKELLRRILSEHYKDGPVYIKYQTLPAICQLYEYFDSGRFNTLGDAYNQYELEVRLDRLVDNSEKALAALSEIRDNQMLLYNALIEVKATLDEANARLDSCIRKLDQLKYVNEIIAICSTQTALATTLLSQVSYYKNRHDLPFSAHVIEGALLSFDAKLLRNKV